MTTEAQNTDVKHFKTSCPFPPKDSEVLFRLMIEKNCKIKTVSCPQKLKPSQYSNNIAFVAMCDNLQRLSKYLLYP